MELLIGDKLWSTWSMRAWLALKRTAAPFTETPIRLRTERTNADARAAGSPSGLVPVLKDGEVTIWDSLAICEYLAEKFPAARLWPADAAARALGRAASAEIHAGFHSLRGECPMDLSVRKQATVSEADNSAAEQELSLVLDRIGQYEALAADALLASQQAHSAGGRPPAAAVGYLRQATDLMQASILPSVESLAEVGASRLDGAYQRGRTAALTGIVWAIVAGLLLTATLITLQLYLAARFRRLLNPALATATALALVFAAVTAGRLGAESGQLKVAKQDAFGSIQALGLTRAVSYDANADESRYLADPGRAAQYQQAFLSKSQQIANVGPVTISGYDAALAADIKAYQRDNADVRFGGYLGAEFRNITFPGERQAAVATLLAFQRYERDDRTLRALANGSPTAAVGYDTGTAPSQSDGAFNQYDAALSSVIAINSAAFTTAVTEGENGTATRYLALAALAGLLVAALTYAGVRSRLSEYR